MSSQKYLERAGAKAPSHTVKESLNNRSERAEVAARSGRVREYAEHRSRKIGPRSRLVSGS